MEFGLFTEFQKDRSVLSSPLVVVVALAASSRKSSEGRSVGWETLRAPPGVSNTHSLSTFPQLSTTAKIDGLARAPGRARQKHRPVVHARRATQRSLDFMGLRRTRRAKLRLCRGETEP